MEITWVKRGRRQRRQERPDWPCSQSAGSFSTGDRSTAAAPPATRPAGASPWPCSGHSSLCTEPQSPLACLNVPCALQS